MSLYTAPERKCNGYSPVPPLATATERFLGARPVVELLHRANCCGKPMSDVRITCLSNVRQTYEEEDAALGYFWVQGARQGVLTCLLYKDRDFTFSRPQKPNSVTVFAALKVSPTNLKVVTIGMCSGRIWIRYT